VRIYLTDAIVHTAIWNDPPSPVNPYGFVKAASELPSLNTMLGRLRAELEHSWNPA
jgi:hypothetical protein